MNGTEDVQRVERLVAAEGERVGVDVPAQRLSSVIEYYAIMESHAVWVMAGALFDDVDETTPACES